MHTWRLLPWLYKWLTLFDEETGVDTGVYAPVVFPEDSDERIPIVVEMSLNEFTAVLSALEKGAILSYPETDQAVVWSFLRNYEYPVSICDLIIDCIQNNPATLQAIIDGLKASEEFNDFISEEVTRLTTGQITGKLIEGPCDNGAIAGRMIALVDRMNENNTDFLQIMEVGTNDEERISTLISAVPAIGAVVPFDELIFVAQDVLSTFNENYQAADTFERRDEMSEDLYCLAQSKPDCALTFQDVFDYLVSEASSPLTIASGILDVVAFIIGGDFSNDDLVFKGMYAIQIGFILTGQSFNEMTLPRMGSLTRDAGSSSRWEEWDDCETPEENCFAPAFAEGTGHNGTLTDQTAEYIEITAAFNASVGYYVAGGTLPSGDHCTLHSYLIIGGTFTPIGGTGEGFGARQWPSGVYEFSISRQDYDIDLFSYQSTTPFSIRVYIG